MSRLRDVKALEGLCVREFSKINGLYLPTDKIAVEDTGDFLSCQYRSKRYSTSNTSEDRYETCTKIMFSELQPGRENGGVGALITYLSVRPDIRHMRFGTKMLEAVESIFRQRGWNKIDVENVTNSDYWENVGYAPRRVRIKNKQKELYTKRLS